ncbi:MAG: CBM-48 domain-containing protein [Eubacteriales bacterium]
MALKGTNVSVTAKERESTAERFPHSPALEPTPALRRRAAAFPALRDSSGAAAQFGWYHGFLRPIVDGEVYFFCGALNKYIYYFCLRGGMELLQ